MFESGSACLCVSFCGEMTSLACNTCALGAAFRDQHCTALRVAEMIVSATQTPSCPTEGSMFLEIAVLLESCC